MSETEDCESRLTQELRAGSEEALATLFIRYRPRLERIIQLRLDARIARRISPVDVLQETYLRGAQRIEHFASQPTLSAFMWIRLLVYQQMTEIYRRHFRAEMRDIRREIPSANWADSNADSFIGAASQLLSRGATPSKVLSQKESFGRLENILHDLRPIYRDIVVLRHFEELSNAEAATALNIDLATARKRYIRAIRKIRERIHNESGEL